jgi:hypothetical protein
MEKLFKFRGSKSQPASRSTSAERGAGEREKNEFTPFWENRWDREETARAEVDSLDKFVRSEEERDRLKQVLSLFNMFKGGDEKPITYPDLDSKISSLIQKFICNEQMDERIRIAVDKAGSKEYKFCKNQITPPTCFAAENKETSLRRLKDLTYLFSNVQQFENSNKQTIKAFLSSMNAAVAEINCGITAAEFRYCLLNKLSGPVRTVVTNHLKGENTLSALYHSLLVLYDSSHTSETAWSMLTNPGNQRFGSLKELLETALNMMDLARVSEETRAPLLIAMLKSHIDPILYDRIIDFKIDYERARAKPISLSVLMDYLSRFRQSIDRQLEKKPTKGGQVYNVQGEVEPVRPQVVRETPKCNNCKKLGHKADVCWNNKNCRTCGGKHATAYCRSCKLCASKTHSSVECPLYKTEPVSGICKFCEEQLGVRVYHPMVMCRNKQNRNGTKN